jgi:hypothetical protein
MAGLVREVCKLPRETEWVEFKETKANLGAVLFARRLDDFAGLGRRAVRVIVYHSWSNGSVVTTGPRPRH